MVNIDNMKNKKKFRPRSDAKSKPPKPKLNHEEFAAELRRRFGMACANTGRPLKKEPDSTAETLKAGSPDPAVSNPDAVSNQTEKATEP
jgi:hypothetical protein